MDSVKKNLFVTGIGTDVGKTVIAATLVEALQADYWKPAQAGELDNTDTHTVKRLVSNEKSHFFDERYRLKEPMSPHAAAELEGIEINLSDFELPKTDNRLIVEGAGGLMVPLNSKGDLIIDLIKHVDLAVVLVSRNYLGSINHTLLSVEALQNREIEIAGIIFNGEPNKATEDVILRYTGLRCLGRVPQLRQVDTTTIESLADDFKDIGL